MVSNTGIEGLEPLAANLSGQDYASDFTSGSNSAGYTLSSVKISLETIGDDIGPPTVRVVSGSRARGRRHRPHGAEFADC